jgi:hypothetical protein
VDTLICASREAIAQLVSQSPADLGARLGVDALADATVKERPAAATVNARALGDSVGSLREGKDVIAEDRRAPDTPPATQPGEASKSVAGTGGDDPPPQRTILTREELAALLEGAEG